MSLENIQTDAEGYLANRDDWSEELANELATDPSVAAVRPARTLRIAAAETIPYGIKRVKAWETGTVPSAPSGRKR